MTPHRTKRSAVRRRATPMFVTERDLDALVLVGLTRYLGADQLARALFPNSDRCTRRARRLFDEGLLQKVVLSSRRPDLLALTGKGIAFVEKRRPEAAESFRDRMELSLFNRMPSPLEFWTWRRKPARNMERSD